MDCPQEAEVDGESQPKRGWQQTATRPVDEGFVSQFTAELGEVDQALMRSQHGPLASAPHAALPTSRQCEDRFAIFPLSALQAPSPPHSLVLTDNVAAHLTFLDTIEQHAQRQEFWGEGGSCWSVQQPRSVVRQGRVSTNVFVRDLDLAQRNRFDGRRLEVVADGLTLWQGAQLAIDTTMVAPRWHSGTQSSDCGWCSSEGD